MMALYIVLGGSLVLVAMAVALFVHGASRG
jgi:hypothetical protein